MIGSSILFRGLAQALPTTSYAVLVILRLAQISMVFLHIKGGTRLGDIDTDKMIRGKRNGSVVA